MYISQNYIKLYSFAKSLPQNNHFGHDGTIKVIVLTRFNFAPVLSRCVIYIFDIYIWYLIPCYDTLISTFMCFFFSIHCALLPVLTWWFWNMKNFIVEWMTWFSRKWSINRWNILGKGNKSDESIFFFYSLFPGENYS